MGMSQSIYLNAPFLLYGVENPKPLDPPVFPLNEKQLHDFWTRYEKLENQKQEWLRNLEKLQREAAQNQITQPPLKGVDA